MFWCIQHIWVNQWSGHTFRQDNRQFMGWGFEERKCTVWMERVPMKAKAHQSSGCSSLPSSKLVSVHLADARCDVFFSISCGQESTKETPRFCEKFVFTMKANNWWSIRKQEKYSHWPRPSETIFLTNLDLQLWPSFRQKHHMLPLIWQRFNGCLILATLTGICFISVLQVCHFWLLIS